MAIRVQPKVLHFLVTKHQQSSVTSWALWEKFSLHSIHTGPTLTCTGDEFVPSKGVNFGHSWVDGFCVFVACFSQLVVPPTIPTLYSLIFSPIPPSFPPILHYSNTSTADSGHCSPISLSNNYHKWPLPFLSKGGKKQRDPHLPEE